jgi:hypothetical protein
MYYARAVNLTTLVALQTKATENMEKRVAQLLDYLHTLKDATIQYVAFGCIIPLGNEST